MKHIDSIWCEEPGVMLVIHETDDGRACFQLVEHEGAQDARVRAEFHLARFRWKRIGWPDETLGIGKIPRRKRLALYRESKGVLVPLAYFVDEKAAKETERMLHRAAWPKEAHDAR